MTARHILQRPSSSLCKLGRRLLRKSRPVVSTTTTTVTAVLAHQSYPAVTEHTELDQIISIINNPCSAHRQPVFPLIKREELRQITAEQQVASVRVEESVIVIELADVAFVEEQDVVIVVEEELVEASFKDAEDAASAMLSTTEGDLTDSDEVTTLSDYSTTSPPPSPIFDAVFECSTPASSFVAESPSCSPPSSPICKSFISTDEQQDIFNTPCTVATAPRLRFNPSFERSPASTSAEVEPESRPPPVAVPRQRPSIKNQDLTPLADPFSTPTRPRFSPTFERSPPSPSASTFAADFDDEPSPSPSPSRPHALDFTLFDYTVSRTNLCSKARTQQERYPSFIAYDESPSPRRRVAVRTSTRKA